MNPDQQQTVERETVPTVRSPRASDLRRNLRLLGTAWSLGSVWLFAISGAAMARYELSLGMPRYMFGVVAALPFLGSLFQVPGGWLLERTGRRRITMLVSYTFGRSMWIAAAAVPWVLPGQSQLWWPLLTLFVALAWAGENFGTPAATSWTADLIPASVRGRFVSSAKRVGRFVALCVSLAIGYSLDLAEKAEPFEVLTLLKVCSLIIGIAGLFGILDIQMFRRMDAAHPPAGKPQPWHEMFARPLADRLFRRYLAMNFTFMLAVGFLGQYIWLFFFDVLKLDNWQANLLLLVAPLLLQLFAYQAWGRFIDRVGHKPVLVIAATMMITGSGGWLLAKPDLIWPAFLIAAVGMCAWPGFEIANFNLLLAAVRGSGKNGNRQAGGSGGSAYVVVNNIAIALGGILSGIIAAVVSKTLPDFHASWLGIDWTYHHLLLTGSMVLRMAVVGWAFTIHEPTAVPTRDAVRMMSMNLYSNARQAALMPTRVVGRAAAWSYRLSRTTPTRS